MCGPGHHRLGTQSESGLQSRFGLGIVAVSLDWCMGRGLCLTLDLCGSMPNLIGRL
jgi:hypothetical protein